MAPLTNCSTTPLLSRVKSADGENAVLDSVKAANNSGKTPAEGNSILDLNHNIKPSVATENDPEYAKKMANEEEAVKRPPARSIANINNRTRKNVFSMFNEHLNTNLNILVLGQRESGKTSLINSMSMALTQQWSDKARYCPGRNHVIDECIMHKNQAGGKVVFSDTRGFEDIHETDHAVLILRYVLEGRIPAKCIPCVLLMNKELIKKRYHKTYEPNRRIDCVLFVTSMNEAPPTHLMTIVQQALATSKHTSVNRIPIISVMTKSDLLTSEALADFEKSRGYQRYSLDHILSNGNANPGRDMFNHPLRKVVNYSCELEPFSDESANPSSVEPSVDKDTQLLAVWRDIISRTTACGGGDRRKRANSASASSRQQMCSCLPFRFDYMRLRSGSF